MANLTDGQIKILNEKAREARQKKFLESSRKHLDKIVKTKITTAFIGALDAFESEFGFLWGHGQDYREITEEQKKMRALWNNARSKILSNGNVQMRNASNEIANYLVSRIRHHTEFNLDKYKDNDSFEGGNNIKVEN